ncbi:MAG: 2-dehydropantoate 2-reductase [Solirubrobacteraceae bacterium]
MPEIALLGPGGVGGFVAAALTRSGNGVTVVARHQTAARVRAAGLTVTSRVLGEFHVHPRAGDELVGAVDALVVTTKATGLIPALERIRTDPPLVVPLLNGLDHLTVLRRRFGTEQVAAGVIRIESDRAPSGVIVQTSPACRVDLATAHTSLAPALDALAAALRAAGLDVRIGDSEDQVMWSKLARLCALALTTSASDRPIGFVRSDPRWRSALEGAIRETVAVANADGARLDAADTLDELRRAHPDLGSSMRRDIAAGREPELDAIAGAVLRAAGRHRLGCPTVRWLAGRVAARAGLDVTDVN